MKKVAVIGAGASGLMAAYAAANRGNEVIVFEKNEKAGKKIYITGKGRCNLTNDSSPEEVLANVVHGEKFLRSSLHAFSPADAMSFFEEGGLPLKVERGNRVFPVSDKASDVTKCLEKYCLRAGVRFCFEEEVRRINRKEDLFHIVTSKRTATVHAVLVCTGGVSYPSTGSTGDGYRFAENFDVAVNALKPALCGICCEMEGLRQLQGLTLKNVALSAVRDGKKLRRLFGEMLFTHFGISGPIVLSMASLLNELPLDEVSLFIDLKPALDEDVLDKRLLRDFERYRNKQMGNALVDLLPKALIPAVLRQSKIPFDLSVNSLSKEKRRGLLNAVKGFKLAPLSLRPMSECIVTAGGVDLKEINPKTMECKKVPGLYFCGEVLDVDALTGGFNLQIAFSTGYAAGSSV